MKLKLFLLIIFTLTMFSGCGKASVKDDILNYVNKELPKVATLERDAIAEYESISGDNFENDAVMYTGLVDRVIPMYESFLDGLQKIKPKTKDLQSIHNLYINSAKEQMEGFSMIVDALKKQDANLITEANKHLDAGRNGIEDFMGKLRDLAEKNNVDIN